MINFLKIFLGNACAAAALVLTLAACFFAQDAAPTVPAGFRIGEKLTYMVSFEHFKNAAFVEISTGSRGNLGGQDVVELRSVVRTLDLASAAFHMIDEERIVYASAESGQPVYIKKIDNTGGLPRSSVKDNTTLPGGGELDLLTAIWKIRNSGGSGTLNFQDGEKTYSISFSTTGAERVKTAAGDFETTVLTIQTEYLAERGILDLKVNVTSDASRIPVVFRFKMANKKEMRADISGIQNTQPQPTPSPIMPIAPTPTPEVSRTPRPAATPKPYIDNLPLAPELSFPLGESLEYRVNLMGRQLGIVRMEARERKQFLGKDSLLLIGTVTSAEPGNGVFAANDHFRAQVDPDTLIPFQADIKFSGSLAELNQTINWDAATNAITFRNNGRVDAPVGTHSILSLLYAMRSFNLKRSPDRNNPVNDTRVAVFWENKPLVFTLRPGDAETIELNGLKMPAQMITLVTGDARLDQLGLKIWLSNEPSRLPLRIAAGPYQADLMIK